MTKKKQVSDIRSDIQIAMQISNEMRENLRVYKETLQTMFSDETIPIEIRRQYERLLVTQLLRGGVF